jgi:hypothetical protein
MYLIPTGTPRTPQGDQSFWEGYELIETLAADGVASHQLTVQARLNAFKFMPDTTVKINDMQTVVYTTQAPLPTQMYLTTIRFSALGTPLSYPIPPA